MAKLIIICCFLWFSGLSALPIIDLDEIPQAVHCPPDSQRNDTLEGCTCLPCPEMPTCSQVLVEIYPGVGEPGSCCPLYKCSDTEPVCNGTNVTYFPNKCTKCKSCNPHAIPCEQFCDLSVVVSNCLTMPNETAVALGGTWTENDGCTSCRCTDDGERDCQATECPPVYCDRPIRKEGECCQTCPDEVEAAPPTLISILQPYSGTTRGPETETGSSTSTAENFPLNPEFEAAFSTVYSDFNEMISSTTDAEVSSDAMENIPPSEAPLRENNSIGGLEASTLSSTDSSIVSPTDQSTTKDPTSTIEVSPSSVFDLTAWTSQSPSETTSTLQKSSLEPEPEAQTPESNNQVKVASQEKVSRDTRNNTELPSYIPHDTNSKWIIPILGAILLTIVVCYVILKRCTIGKKINGNYHEVSTQQPQEVCNLKSFDDPSLRKLIFDLDKLSSSFR